MKTGKIIPNGVKLETHEYDTVLFFTNMEKDVELIPPSNMPHMRRADFLMDGSEWEMKSPVKSTARTLERAFYQASGQSENIIIDLRRLCKGDQEALKVLEKCFNNTRKVRKMCVVMKDGMLREYKK